MNMCLSSNRFRKEVLLVKLGRRPLRPPVEPELPDQMRAELRLKQLTRSTEKAYLKRGHPFLRVRKDGNHGRWSHPSKTGQAEIEEFLSWLAIRCSHDSIEVECLEAYNVHISIWNLT